MDRRRRRGQTGRTGMRREGGWNEEMRRERVPGRG